MKKNDNPLIAALEELEKLVNGGEGYVPPRAAAKALVALAKLIRSGEERRMVYQPHPSESYMGLLSVESSEPRDVCRYHVIYLGKVAPTVVVTDKHREMARVALNGADLCEVPWLDRQIESSALALAELESKGGDDD